MRSFPEDDQRPTSSTLLTDPWTAGVTGWIVVFVALIAELAGGAAVANQMSATLALLVLIIPVAVAFGFAVVQWWQVRSSGTEPAGWWHLGGIAAALLVWGLWPTVPGALAGSGGARRGKRRPFVLRCPARHRGIAVPAPCRPGR